MKINTTLPTLPTYPLHVSGGSRDEPSNLYVVATLGASVLLGGVLGWPVGVLAFCCGYFGPRMLSNESTTHAFFPRIGSQPERFVAAPNFWQGRRVLPQQGNAPRDAQGNVLPGGRQPAQIAQAAPRHPQPAPVRGGGQFDAQGNKMPGSRG